MTPIPPEPKETGMTTTEPPAGNAAAVTRYRKKPIEIETLEWTGANFTAIRAFVGDDDLSRPGGGGELFVWNEQEHEWIEVPLGHSVVKGALGEFYPISPAAIAATYEPAGEEPA